MDYRSTVTAAIDDLRSDGREKILLAVAFGWFLSISVRMIYPTLLPHIRDSYGLTLTTAGFLLTVLWIAYAFGQLPGGILADWAGERVLLIASSVLAATMLALVVLANSAVVLFAATALFGAGTALYGVSRFTILDKVYPDQLGTATGATMAAGDVGNAVMPPLAGVLAVTVGWQYGFGFAVPLFLVAAVGLWWTLPNQSTAAAPLREQFSLEDIAPTLSQPVVLRGTLLLVLWGVIIQAFMGFYPTYLIDERGFSAQTAAALFGFFFALGILLKPIAGRAYDSLGVRVPLLVVVSSAGLALLVLPFVGTLWAFVLVTVFASSLLGFETVVISDLTQRLPDGTQGTNLGALRTVYLAIGAASPVVFGAIADRGYFDEAFLGIGALAGVIFLIVFVSIKY
ncbi:major facilitator superfamily protein [Natronococcus amylolyticus DSM 10524]|uniref:Major facilitator superfamily protein n=1 Tax=Natronococcus amylolyticus DSM 10524 TaxID=1227497 RepID=L9X480_9EURY|nr:MFS transporter [Natronococcus amylolyticus]ELY55403.1 major facilitator superfamily protein [Natronococcus amylolyticus DSM 10524]